MLHYIRHLQTEGEAFKSQRNNENSWAATGCSGDFGREGLGIRIRRTGVERKKRRKYEYTSPQLEMRCLRTSGTCLKYDKRTASNTGVDTLVCYEDTVRYHIPNDIITEWKRKEKTRRRGEEETKKV